jgi:hypothetical protein
MKKEHEKGAAIGGRPVGSHLDATVSIEQAYRVIAFDKRQQTEGPANGRVLGYFGRGTLVKPVR